MLRNSTVFNSKQIIDHTFQKHSNDMEYIMAAPKINERTRLIRLLKKVGL